MASPSSKNKVLVVLSGGVDSTTLLHMLRQQYGHDAVMAVSFYYGSRHNAQELACAERTTARLGTPWQKHDISASFVSASALMDSGAKLPEGHYADQTMRSTVVPLRNGIMLMIAASMAESMGAGFVALGAHAGDHAIYPDCRPDFLAAIARSIELGTYAGVQLLRPFSDATKADIVANGARMAVRFEDTYSCYRGDDLHCGRCGTCVERLMCFDEAKVPDPQTYEDREFYKTVRAPAGEGQGA